MPTPTRRQAGAIFVLLLAALLSHVDLLQARTWRVWKDGSGDHTAIQPAVDAAAEGDTILIGPGRYTESFDFPYDGALGHGETFVGVVTDNLTLMGVDRDSVVIGPWEQSFQGFLPKGIAMQFPATTGLRVENLTVINAREGLRLVQLAEVSNCVLDSSDIGIIALPESLTIRSTVIKNSKSHGLFAVGDGQVSLTGCTLSSNPGQGATFTEGAIVEMVDCDVSRNAGGVTFQGGTQATIQRCTFIDNLFGAIDLTTASSAQIRHVVARGGRNGLITQLESIVTGSRNVFGPFDEDIVVAVGYSRVDLSQCDFRIGFPSAIRVEGYPPGPGTVFHDFRDNFWGLTDSASIADVILDGVDDPNVDSFVLFEPFELESTPTDRASIGGLKARYKGRGNR